MAAASSSRDAPQPAASASRSASKPANEASDLWVHIFDFTDLGVGLGYHRVAPEHACVIGAVSQLWCLAVQALSHYRLAGIKRLAHQRFPQLESDIKTWGEPYAYFPLPTWRLWRVDVWSLGLLGTPGAIPFCCLVRASASILVDVSLGWPL